MTERDDGRRRKIDAEVESPGVRTQTAAGTGVRIRPFRHHRPDGGAPGAAIGSGRGRLEMGGAALENRVRHHAAGAENGEVAAEWTS